MIMRKNTIGRRGVKKVRTLMPLDSRGGVSDKAGRFHLFLEQFAWFLKVATEKQRGCELPQYLSNRFRSQLLQNESHRRIPLNQPRLVPSPPRGRPPQSPLQGQLKSLTIFTLLRFVIRDPDDSVFFYICIPDFPDSIVG